MTGNFTENEMMQVSSRFEKKNNEVRAYYLEKLETDHELKIRINELVEIVHDEHKDWSFNKIAQYIWIMNQDLDGFSKNHINKNLTQENRILLDIQEPKPKPKQPKKPKSLPSELLEEFRQKKGKEGTKLQNNVMDYSLTSKSTFVLEDSSVTLNNSAGTEGEQHLFDGAIDSVYDLKDETKAEPHVIYDNPQKIIQQHEQRIIQQEKELDTWQVKYEELETKYEQVITPFEVRQTAIVKDQELPFIVKVDPYKRSIDFEVDQKEVKKLNRF